MCGVYIYCQLSGSIPENINELTEIEQLRLEYNYFSGYIPESICDLNMNYEDNLSFDLTGNLICPPYPSCLVNNIVQQDTSNCSQTSIIEQATPITYNLYNAYPNPFNSITILRYDLPKNALVNITIHDMIGKEVSTLVSSQQTADYKSVRWNATNDKGVKVSTGLYLYNIVTEQYRQTKKMILLK